MHIAVSPYHTTSSYHTVKSKCSVPCTLILPLSHLSAPNCISGQGTGLRPESVIAHSAPAKWCSLAPALKIVWGLRKDLVLSKKSVILRGYMDSTISCRLSSFTDNIMRGIRIIDPSMHVFVMYIIAISSLWTSCNSLDLKKPEGSARVWMAGSG